MTYKSTFFFWVILVLSACVFVPTYTQNLHVNTPINNASGIYFERIATMGKSTSYWKFIIHFDFTSHETEAQLLMERHRTLIALCNELKAQFMWEPCKTTLKVINSTLNEVSENNYILRQLFRPPEKARRGLINGMGRLSKFLFGTMDDEDAENLEASLKSLRKTQNKLHHLVKSRTSVLVNTVETVSKNQNVLNEQFQTLKANLSTLVQNIQNKTDYERVFHLFDEISNLMTLTLEQFLKKQAELTDIMHEAQAGKLDKHLANSILFLNAFKEVQLELPQDLQLPLKPTTVNLQLLDKIIQVNPLYASNNLTLQVSVPLISDFYQLYKLTSIPAKRNDSLYYFIKTRSDYVAINEKLKQYIFLEQSELNKCTNVDNDLYICKQNYLLYNQNSENCIIKIILNNQDLTRCEIGVFKVVYENWHPLSKANTWLYVLPYPTNLRIVCNEVAYSIKINQSGILELFPGCRASTSQVSLETVSEAREIKQLLYHFNSTFIDEELNLTVSPEKLIVKTQGNINVGKLDLDQISISLHDLIDSDQEVEDLDIDSEILPSSIVFNVVLSVLIIVLLLNVLYFILKKCIKCKVTTLPQNGKMNVNEGV